MAFEKAEFLKELFTRNEEYNCNRIEKKSFKNWKKLAKSGQEVHSLPLDYSKTEKRRKIIFASKLSQNLARNDRRNRDKFTLQELQRMSKSRENGVFIRADRIEVTGIKLRPIRHLFFRVVFLS